MTDVLLVALSIAILGILLIFVAPVLKKILSVQEEEEKLPYRQKAHFFTQSEYVFFQALVKALPREQFRIFPKVRMGDYIEPISHGTERFGDWNRIKSRHVDFLIWNIEKGKFELAIELDGNSHNGKNAQNADNFKDKLFEAVGIELVRVQVGSDFAKEAEEISRRAER